MNSSIIPYPIQLKHSLLAGMLLFFLTGCDQPARKKTLAKKNDAGFTENYSIPGGKVVSHSYEGNKVKEIYVLDAFQNKEGYSFHYNENGVLATLSRWENGVKAGRELIFAPSGQLKGIYPYQNGLLHGDVLLFGNPTLLTTNGSLNSHQLFKEGIKVYEGFYQGGKKHLNKLYPHFLEEFFFEDKYYAKVRFLLDYPGQLVVRIRDRGTPVIENLGDNTFQLVINDALDLNGYELELSYKPAVRDTLVSSSYSYTHIIFVTE